MTEAIIALVGVIVGGLITPLVTSRIDTARLKKSLKPELIRLLTEFFEFRKQSVGLTNRVLLFTKIHATTYEVDETTLQGADRVYYEKIAKTFEGLKSQAESETVMLHEHFYKQISVVSNLQANLTQFKAYFGNALYEKLERIIQPAIDEGEKFPALHQYKDLTTDQLGQLLETIDDELLQEYLRLNSNFQSLKKQILKLI